ncbi:arylamine N-acetyltransferase [Jeotgalibacillus aurantiacus]|uniref:arylamine N-acetyltransferase n=1 Tax=Jeotgalibacillus aurantiacus TaxID=2763266 RepID=UPI001D0BD922|nr:arylamine N-acetyltransferase [Jeotgalibacillus aurantiacus]
MLIDRFLTFLDVEKKEPSLSYLNELIHAHQTKVRWETLSKFIDYENLSPADAYLPSMDSYIDRIINKGVGGTCYTLARGFHLLLSELGFDVNYLFMEPNHLCLRVDLEGEPYYVDVGYSAPLFKAYPMFESFEVVAPAETFTYTVMESKILVERNPGPTKTLNPEPVSWSEIEAHIKGTYDWKDGFAFQSLKLFGYLDGVPVSLRNHELRIFKESGFEDQVLNPEEVMGWVRKFDVNEEFYKKAVSIFVKRKNVKPY